MIKSHKQENTMNYSDEDLKQMTKWSEENTKTEPTNAGTKTELLKENGGLQNLAQKLSQGYTIAAYVMNSKTRAAIDEWIAQHPDRNAPYSTAPTEIDETVDLIMVRLNEPDIDMSNNDEILERMKSMAKNMPRSASTDLGAHNAKQ